MVLKNVITSHQKEDGQSDSLNKIDPQIEQSWKEILSGEFKKPYFFGIKDFLTLEKDKGKKIFPPGNLIFNAYNSTPFNQVKVVIIGQDPYHGDNQAHGLCFSVQDKITPPPSLANIYKELSADLGISIHPSGNLQKWTEQGVFLLNAILTVEARKPASHRKIGWEMFTNETIKILSERKQNLVFLLWGKYAQEKSLLIDTSKHLILKSTHPSPFSAHYGFLGCKHFSKTNKYLKSKGISIVDWQL
ncbi:MAG TPA: uracil-DNA glycosylase [Flavobacteriales bacterium]|nr:uracil-DNA glycosylase [Flavobacteriales bacterium]